jgi:simple sugar transport system ATP-binding protein
MQSITKEYAGVVANDAVNLDVHQGEIHALVGENGAGKSTLMKILYGLEHPDSGRICINDQPVTIASPQVAIQRGIGMVHQHFQLIPSLTVAENICLGYEPRRYRMFADTRRMIERTVELAETFGMQIDPTKRIADLSVGVRQRVEILKLLYRDARLLILDEPTAVLTPQEVDSLFAVILRLVEEGRTAIFITHKLREVMAICQRATILRRGCNVATVNVADSTPRDIARMMVGEDVVMQEREPQPVSSQAILSMRGVSARDERGLLTLNDINLDVHGGEILGLAGVEGNGQFELLEVLTGLRSVQSGEITLAGTQITHLSNRKRRELGFALIPEDRSQQGLSPVLSIWENLIASDYYQPSRSRYGYMPINQLQADAHTLMNRYDIRANHERVAVATLSGGNAQKVVVARELANQPQLLVAAQPTRGLDIRAAGFVHDQLLKLRAEGRAILLISAELDELLALCDRFVVIFGGRIVGTLAAKDATRETLGLLMAGRVEKDTPS